MVCNRLSVSLSASPQVKRINSKKGRMICLGNRRKLGSQFDNSIQRFFFTSRLFLLLIAGMFFSCASAPPPIYTDGQLYDMANVDLDSKKYGNARQNIEELEKLYPDSPHIADARLVYADTYYKQGEYVDAIVQYQRFLDFHPRNKLADKAQYRMAMSYMNQIPNYERDQTFTEKAVETFEQLLAKYPDSPLVSESKTQIKILKKQLAESIFNIAEFYYRNENYDASIKRFRQILLKYPQENELAEKAMMFLAHSYLSQGSRQEARTLYRLFLKKFPDSVYTNDVQEYLER